MKSTRLKLMSLCCAGAALAVMGVVTVGHSSAGLGGSPAVIATGNSASSGPATTPTVASAGPAVKATTFSGGDWPGMGSFGEDWAK